MPVGGVAGRGLFVSRGYCSEFLDLCEVVFDEVPPLVGMFVVVARNLSVCLGRDDRRRAACIELGEEPIGVERLVGQQRIEMHASDQRRDAFDVMRLTRQQEKIEQVSLGVDERNDLGCQSAPRAPDGLMLSPPFEPLAIW